LIGVLPAGQVKQKLDPVIFAYFPPPQLVQRVAPVVDAYWPIAQLTQLIAFETAEYFPISQLTQETTPLVVDEYCPGTQVVCATAAAERVNRKTV
jgi:hypothetical protein